jgi:hypothetical protein
MRVKSIGTDLRLNIVAMKLLYKVMVQQFCMEI